MINCGPDGRRNISFWAVNLPPGYPPDEVPGRPPFPSGPPTPQPPMPEPIPPTPAPPVGPPAEIPDPGPVIDPPPTHIPPPPIRAADGRQAELESKALAGASNLSTSR